MSLLADAESLRLLLKEDAASITDDAANLLLQLATGAVQNAAGQDLLQVEGDTVTLMGTRDQWFNLPQRPVTTVTAISVDGEALTAGTDYKRFGARLWRRRGWARCHDEPSEVTVTYTHGFEGWDPKLALARGATLVLAAKMSDNPTGATGFTIDDYSQQYAQSSAQELAEMIPENLRRSLRRAYGARGRLVRIG
jgi:hypothetical protein